MFWLSLASVSLVVFWCHSTKANVTWPNGKYGLPMPKAGCPNNWFDGRRFHDNSSGNLIDRKVYESLHLAGWVSKEGIEQDFCIKTSKDNSQDWPEGRYCILKHEACPAGLAAGSAYWRPSSSHFQDSSVNGKQLKNTTINYCCSARGTITNAISLPLEKPFYMYSLSGDRCQQVKGATVKEESVNFDKAAGRYQINMVGENPFHMDKNGAQMKLTYCYYTPGGTVAIPESQEVEKTLFTGSELDNKTQSSGMAVAIGVGIACAMVGSASIALVTKKLMRKKNEDDDDDEPRPDDP
ncbi:hypothetical protein OS493_017690 [Desmophyllum pertusum]|uniref:Apextrin C-terminal domain-containing protein n=1 Tax=Desmophyllum pertusum TaxID=174260 RepID=A0A9W9ZD31_9CNID|nr:hypothetical protein OS493_017690 [Desmophyllum pertusum]